MYERFDEKGKVICQECGKSFGTITVSHLKMHDISMKQYIEKFPDFPLRGLPFIARENKSNNIQLFKEIIRENDEIDKIRAKPLKEISPEIHEDEITDVIKEKVSKKHNNKIGKDGVFYNLKKSYPNLQLNYVIRKKRHDGILVYQFITDMADPIKKIDFEFPDTFWHNIETMQDSKRDKKLKEDGWRILKFKGVKPNMKAIEKDLDIISD